MPELPEKSLIALAKRLPSTDSLERLQEEMGIYITWISSRGKSACPFSNPKFQIDDLAYRVSNLLQTPLGLDLILAILPSLIEISKSGRGGGAPAEPEPATL